MSGARYTTRSFSAWHRLHIVNGCTYVPEWHLSSDQLFGPWWPKGRKREEIGEDIDTEVFHRWACKVCQLLAWQNRLMFWSTMNTNGKMCSFWRRSAGGVRYEALTYPKEVEATTIQVCSYATGVYDRWQSIFSFSFDIHLRLIYLSIVSLLTAFCLLGWELMLQKA